MFSALLVLLLLTSVRLTTAATAWPLADSLRLQDSLLQTTRGEFALVAYAGGGLSYYSTSIGIPNGLENIRISRFGVPLSVRVMWHPDHRLRLGLETGWTTMYSYTSQIAGEDAKVYVSAFPILAVWSMPIARRFNVFAGTGAFIVNSFVDYSGKVNVDTFSLGWMVAGSYVYPISKNLGIAGEVKWLDAIETEDANLVFQIQLVWKFFRW
jgi:hypothetical protein